ncbi:MAG TPA: peptidylprolyl isomerase [Xanthobacteraceae bacterium]|nr:peptidylprolyl isomerase [Xanthobacteraceae bacterium]
MSRKPFIAILPVAAAFFLVAGDQSVRAQSAAPQSRASQSAGSRSAAPVRTGTSAPVAHGSATRPTEFAIKDHEVVARLGATDVTAEELRSVFVTLDARQQAALARDPALLSQTVRALLANRLVLSEALAKKWEQQPAVMAQLARAREALIVETYLQSVTLPPETFPSETEVKAVYDANASAFLVPRRFQLAQILIAVPAGADKATEDAARKKLDAVLKKAKQPGADFTALAKTESDDAASAERGGDIGWIAEAELRPEIRSQVAGLAKGAVADAVRLDNGWHIVKLIDTQPSHTRPLAEVKDALVQRMRAERAEASRRNYLAGMLKQSPPVINEIALSKLLENGASPVQPASSR